MFLGGGFFFGVKGVGADHANYLAGFIVANSNRSRTVSETSKSRDAEVGIYCELNVVALFALVIGAVDNVISRELGKKSGVDAGGNKALKISHGVGGGHTGVIIFVKMTLAVLGLCKHDPLGVGYVSGP